MNALVNEFKERLETIKAWRHHLHKHPELSLEEATTAKYIADLVKSWGYDVVEGSGKYGIVASLTAAFGDEAVMYPGPSCLGSEDFAFMLQKKQGTYCLLGNGDTPMVHHPQYVFDDDILPLGAAYRVALTEQYLRE